MLVYGLETGLMHRLTSTRQKPKPSSTTWSPEMAAMERDSQSQDSHCYHWHRAGERRETHSCCHLPQGSLFWHISSALSAPGTLSCPKTSPEASWVATGSAPSQRCLCRGRATPPLGHPPSAAPLQPQPKNWLH